MSIHRVFGIAEVLVRIIVKKDGIMGGAELVSLTVSKIGWGMLAGKMVAKTFGTVICT